MGLYKGLHVAVVSCQSCILSTSCHNSGVSQLYNAMCSWQVARLFPGIHSHKALREATLNAKLCGRNRCIYYCMYIYIYCVLYTNFPRRPPLDRATTQPNSTHRFPCPSNVEVRELRAHSPIVPGWPRRRIQNPKRNQGASRLVTRGEL